MTTSKALRTWRGDRARRLDNLVVAHQAIAGPGRGRKWLTAEINHAMFVRLTTELQGFARELHTEAADHIIAKKLASDPAMGTIVRALLMSHRQLDRFNPSWANICNDFGHFGISLKDELNNRADYTKWMQCIEYLMKARNAIAHDDVAKLLEVEQEGRLTKTTFTRSRRHIDTLVGAMDDVVGQYLDQLTGSSW